MQQNGPWFILVLLVPVALSIAEFAAIIFRVPKAAEWLLAGTLLFFCLLTGYSIGIFYLPAALLSIIAVALDKRASRSLPVLSSH